MGVLFQALQLSREIPDQVRDDTVGSSGIVWGWRSFRYCCNFIGAPIQCFRAQVRARQETVPFDCRFYILIANNLSIRGYLFVKSGIK